MSRRALTNWLGNSSLPLFSKTALSLTVPVVGSIWLSTVNRYPVAIFRFPSRSHASTGIFFPPFIRARSPGRLSSGMEKTTVTGCSCVITISPFGSVAWIMFPASTSRSPTRPPIGAVMRE